jgi:CHAT domain-containing protein
MNTILFLSANPKGTDELELIKECNIINQKIRASAGGRELFKLEQRHDISIKSLIEELLNYDPKILHFSGHGSEKSALIFTNENTGQSEEVPPDALANLFKALSNKIDVVFLNACYSEKQAKAIAQHIHCVIGMSDAVYDTTAIEFASTFYLSLGFKKSVKEAFDLAAVQIGMLSLPGPAVPQLIVKEGIDPSKLFINGTTSAPPPPPPPNDLCGQFESLKQNHKKLLMQQITINEFFKVIADSIFTFLSDSNNKKKIGEVNSNALNLLLINLSNKVNEFDSLNQLGNNSQANIVRNESMNVAQKLIDKLETICK